MKKIALIMDGWKRFFTYAWPAGILQRLRETGEAANLYIFNSSGDWSRDNDYNIGEYNIYRLPDLNDFDGIILDLNNIRYKNVRDNVIEAAKKTGKPVISIANEIEDFYYVGIDNHKAIQKMIAHMHEHHHCRRFWFIMGPADNYENKVRVNALKEYMQKHDIPYGEQNFYYESYEYQCGCNGFDTMLGRFDGKIPEAVICANDNIAVGVCEAAARKGYRVPEDFLVSGFDNFDKACFYSPHLTTIGHIREEVGCRCAEILLKLWDGQHVPRFNYTKTTCIFWESCGCTEGTQINEREHAKEQIMYGIETNEFEEQTLALEYELIRCQTVREMMKWIPECIPAMKCDAMYLIIDEHMDDYHSQAEKTGFLLNDEEEFQIEGYPERMNVAFAYENGKIRDTEGMKITELFPMFDFDEGGTDFLFMPLHFRNYTVGYFVIRNAVYLMEKQYLFQIVNTLTSAMENLHKKERLTYMNQKLSDLYVRDSMTGMYNRLGYQRLAYTLFDRKKTAKENLLILFIDMDRLKYINDNFGHVYGDFAIRATARTIMQNCSPDAVPVRTGGDEFLVIHEKISEETLARIIRTIRQEISQTAEQMNLPYPLTVSIGAVFTDMDTDKTLDDYVREADEIMYAEKTAKKANRRD